MWRRLNALDADRTGKNKVSKSVCVLQDKIISFLNIYTYIRGTTNSLIFSVLQMPGFLFCFFFVPVDHEKPVK